MNLQPIPPSPSPDAFMKPSKVAAAVKGDASFFEGLIDAQESSGSGHHEVKNCPNSGDGPKQAESAA